MKTLELKDFKVGLPVTFWKIKKDGELSNPVDTEITHNPYDNYGQTVCFVKDVSGFVLCSHITERNPSTINH